MTNTTEVMVDLETLAVATNAAVVSIGAVRFNLEEEDTEESIRTGKDRIFYVVVNVADAMKFGSVDPSTLKWWLNQGEEARQIFSYKQPTERLRTMLVYFNEFVKIDEFKARNVWGNGSGFDCAILENTYKAQELEMTWRFTQQRDMRTIKEIAKRIEPNVSHDIEIGTRHNALDDSIKQVLLVQRYYRVLCNEPRTGDLKNV